MMNKNQRTLSYIESRINMSRGTPFSPYGYNNQGIVTPDNISNYITPVQFERMAQDIRGWRDAIKEAEFAFYPMRVKMNRINIDTIENGYVKSVVARWKELILQRDFEIYQIKNGKKIVSNDLSQQLREQYWFGDYLEYVLDANLWGYTLIELRDIVNDSFPNLTFTRRQNIRPDGLEGSGPILTSLVYAIDGVRVKEDPLIDMCNHWIPTKSNIGVSNCGYGLLYDIAFFEIHLRHITEWNVDYAEMYGQPIKVGKTNKIGKERDKFEAFLANSGSNAYALLDKGTNDEIEYVLAQNAGTAWKSYENLEQRFQGVIAQLLLGHTDGMKSTPGKLGGNQAAGKDGNNVNLISQAMNSKSITYGNFCCRSVNEIGAPRFRRLGSYVGSKLIKGLFPVDYKFGLQNDMEENEIKRRLDTRRTAISTYTKGMNDAGYDIDVKQLSDEFGMDLTMHIPEHKLIEERTNTIIKDDAAQTKDSGTAV